MHQAPLTRTSLKLPHRHLGHRPACKHSLGSDPMTGTGSASQLVGLHLRNPSLMDYYSFNRPRRDGRLSWPCWLTDSGCFTHKVVTRPAISLAQDRESSPARTGGLTTMLHHQLNILEVWRRARREAARRLKSEWKVNLGNRNSSRSNSN